MRNESECGWNVASGRVCKCQLEGKRETKELGIKVRRKGSTRVTDAENCLIEFLSNGK